MPRAKRARAGVRHLRWITLLAAYLGVLLVGWGLARLWHFEVIGRTTDDEASGLVLAVGALLIIVRFIVWRIVDWAPFDKSSSVDEVSDAELHPLPVPVDADAVSTVLLSLNTNRYLVRTVEEVAVGDGYYHHTISTQYHLPLDRDLAPRPLQDEATAPAPPQMIRDVLYLIPLARIPRGTLFDNFSARDAAGAPLNTLNSDEAAGLNERIILTLVRALIATPTNQPLDLNTDNILISIFKDLRLDGPLEGTEEDSEAGRRPTLRVDDPIDRLAGLARPEEADAQDWAAMLARLVDYCRLVRETHIVFAAVYGQPGHRIALTHSYTRRHAPDDPRHRDRVRYWFGLRPHKHEIPVYEHLHAQSYHFEFRAPLDQYVYDCSVDPIARDDRGRRKATLVVSPLDGSGARDYAHVYARRYRERDPGAAVPMLIGIDCREKPPGLLGAVAVVAIAQMILIWVIGAFHSFYFPAEAPLSHGALQTLCMHAKSIRSATATGPQTFCFPAGTFGTANSAAGASTDVVAILLALPGVVAAWLGAQVTGERLRSTSLSTIFGLLSCATLAVASTAGAVIKAAGGFVGAGLGTSHPLWLCVMLVSAGVTSDLTVRVVARSLRFGARMNYRVMVRRRTL